MASVGPSGGSTLRRIKIKAGVIGGLIGSFATFTVSLLGIEPFRAWSCRTRYIQSAVLFMCDDKYKPISTQDAATFLTGYYNKATGNNNLQDAWKELDKDAQEAEGRQKWEEDNRRLPWAEVIGYPVRTSGYNTFQVNVREYELAGPSINLNGQITIYSRSVELRREGNRPLLHRTEKGSKVGHPQEHQFPRLTVASAAVVHEKPSLHSPESRGAHVGEQVIGICQLERLSASSPSWGGLELDAANDDDVGWWMRIPQGWVRNSALREGRLGMINGLPECDDRARLS